MKNRVYKSRWTRFAFWGLLISAIGFTSCKGNNEPISDKPTIITAVYLEDATSTVTDRKVEFARIGQTLRLEGSGLLGLEKIYFNGHASSFNPALATDNNVFVSISALTPTIDSDPAKRNTIMLKKNGIQYTYTFEIRASAPTITSVSHTMPLAGDSITINGTGLQGITSVTFPGNIVVTEGIVSDDVDGRYCTVTVPAGVSTDGGSILVIGANGGAYSPAFFNFKKGLLHNFDDVNNASWSNGEISDDLSDVIPANGNLPKSQGIYRSLNKNATTMAASDAAVDITRYWINNSVWATILNSTVIPGSTTSDQVAVQMDIYVVGEWNSGDIRFVVADGFGASRYCMIYAPWESDGKRVPFVNPGHWFTITLPFSDSADFEGTDFQGILNVIAGVTYAQAGPWLENGPVNGVLALPSNVNVYFDNIRVVPLNTPTYSDFPE